MVPRIKGPLPVEIFSTSRTIIISFFDSRLLFRNYESHLISVYDFSVCARSDRYLVGKYQYHYWLAGWLPSISDDRSFIYGRRLACVSRNRSAPTRMHFVAGEKRRNIGKWFWKVRLCQSSTAPGVIRNEIAWNRRDEYLVSRSRVWESADWLELACFRSDQILSSGYTEIQHFSKYDIHGHGRSKTG